MSSASNDRVAFTFFDYVGLGLILVAVEAPGRMLIFDDHPVTVRVLVGSGITLLMGAFVLYFSKLSNRSKSSEPQWEMETYGAESAVPKLQNIVERMLEAFYRFVDFIVSTIFWIIVAFILALLFGAVVMPSDQSKKVALDPSDPFAITNDAISRCADSISASESCVNNLLKQEGRKWSWDRETDQIRPLKR